MLLHLNNDMLNQSLVYRFLEVSSIELLQTLSSLIYASDFCIVYLRIQFDANIMSTCWIDIFTDSYTVDYDFFSTILFPGHSVLLCSKVLDQKMHYNELHV